MTKRQLHVRLWHSPYNGGWIRFDGSQWRRFRCGWGAGRHDWKGGPDPVLWWCLFGFCGYILIQSWPWQKDPGKRLKERLAAMPQERGQ
jgi:hypothetical protein